MSVGERLFSGMSHGGFGMIVNWREQKNDNERKYSRMPKLKHEHRAPESSGARYPFFCLHGVMTGMFHFITCSCPFYVFRSLFTIFYSFLRFIIPFDVFRSLYTQFD